MNNLQAQFNFDNPTLVYKIIVTAILAIALYIIRQLSTHLIQNIEPDLKKRYVWRKRFDYISYFIFFVSALPVWFIELRSLSTFLGLLSAGLAVALKDPIVNFFAWVYIVVKKPFEMGDRIQLDTSEGDILDIGFFEFTMLEIKNWVQADQSTGRIIYVPNGLLFTKPVVNYNQAMNFIWNEIIITITFESDWQKAKKILQDIENEHLKSLVDNSEEAFDKAKKKFYIEYKTINPKVYTKVVNNGVQLTLRYLCHPKMRRNTEQIAYEEILTRFAQHTDIRFAYPTTRFYRD